MIVKMNNMEHGRRSFENQEKIKQSEYVGCYYCCKIYEAKLIKEYCKDKNGYTAICLCGIDSVIPYDEEIDKDVESFKKYLEECYEKSF